MSILNKYPQNIINVVDAIYNVIPVKSTNPHEIDEIKESIAFPLNALIENTVDRAIENARFYNPDE